MKGHIVFKYKNWHKLTSYLFKDADNETAAYGLYKESTANSSQKLLVNEIIFPHNSDYLKRSSSMVAFEPKFTTDALQYCLNHNFHLLDIHTHPWAKKVNFSSIDDRAAINTKIPYLKRYVGGVKICFIVFGKSPDVVQARFWDKYSDKLISIPKIVII